MTEIVEILKAFRLSPPLSQFICVLILLLTGVCYRTLKTGLSKLDNSLERINLGLSKFARDSGGNPSTAESIRLLFQKEPRIYPYWLEFFESIASEHDGDTVHLKATSSAAGFFSFDNLVHAIEWRRFKFEFFSAIPGVLTGLGLLGTFAGLVTGLGEVDGDIQATVSKMIGPFLIHMRGAFVASMFGVLCGLIFNILERFSREKVQSHCMELSNAIDQIFPRRTDQSILDEIRSHTEKQLSEMRSLAMDIGNEVARGIVGNAAASIPVDQGLKEGIARGFGILAQSLSEFVDLQKSFGTSMIEMQNVQRGLSVAFSEIQQSAKATSDQILAASAAVSTASSSIGSVSASLSEISQSIGQASEKQSVTAQMLGEKSSDIIGTVNQLIVQQTEMQNKFQTSIEAFDTANQGFADKVRNYHEMQNSSLTTSLRTFDSSLAKAVEKLDGGLGSLNVLMDDFVERLSSLQKKE